MTSTIGELIPENGRQMGNEVDMANTLNDYFSAVFMTQDIHASLPTATPDTHRAPHFTVTEN